MIKRILLGLLVFLLLASAGFVVYKIDGTRTFSEIVESGDLSNLRLTIYYMSSGYLTVQPLSIEGLIGSCDYKIVVKSSDLEAYNDYLIRLSKEPLLPFEKEGRIDARVYYVFETKLGHKLYDVAWPVLVGGIYVNGMNVKKSDIFYDVILPFLPQDAADDVKYQRDSMK
ncbi:MAG TPA: hypothetical protein PKH29_11855 [Oscillospiraceae bacterium]|nr:hypothetical protein [Oscillospiraceae bacterium]